MNMRIDVTLCVLAGAVACAPATPLPPEPGALRAGVATVALDAPVGIATGGYGRSRKLEDPVSPWADQHVPTIGVQTQPTARALALSNGVTTVVLVRIDTCLTVATLRWRAQELLEASGRQAALVLIATHTHAGPGRYFHPAPAAGTGGIDPAKVGMDSFDAEIEARLAGSIASAAGAALDGLRPVAVDVATVEAGELNRDRRCSNDDLYGPGFRDTTLTVVRLDEVDDSGAPIRPLSGLIHFSLHGTVLDDDNHLLSTDAPGAIELAASDAIGAPLVFLQGAAGDVSPNTSGHGEFQGTEFIGRVAAKKVADAWERAAPGPAPRSEVFERYELPLEPSRAAIGYAEGEFPENGGAACGLGQRHCPPVEVAPRTIICIPLKRRPFRETSVAAVRLGPVLIGTLPGEPTAAEGEKVKAAGTRLAGVTNVLTAGYSQDHFGYLLEEKDYLRLGYEPYVSPLGWKFGDFIVGKLGDAFSALGTQSPAMQRPVTEPFEPRAVTPSAGAPRALAPTPDLHRLEAANFVFEGGDPSLGTPRVALEREVNGQFEPVRASAVRFVEGGPEIVLFLEQDPSVADSPTAPTRAHRWRAIWETLPDTPLGRYRLVASGRTVFDGAESMYRVESNVFTLSRTTAFGVAGSATLSISGELALTLRLPPNPSVHSTAGTVIANFRLRDDGARANEGARARGGSVRVELTQPDGVTRPVQLTWDEARGVYFASNVAMQSGTYRLIATPEALEDGLGNTNGTALTLNVVVQ